MNNIKNVCLAIALCAAAVFQVDVCAKQGTSLSSMPTKPLVDAEAEEVINAEADKLTMMTKQAQAIIDGANETIKITKNKSRRGEISRAKAAVIVGDQEYLIKQEKKRLAQVVKNAEEIVEEVEAQAGYSLSGLISGIKSWYYGPEERRSAAQAALAQLQSEFKNAEEEYTIKMQAADPAAAGRARDEWNTLKQDFENEINRQKKIASGGMSTGFWVAVAGAGAVIGSAIAYKYLKPAQRWEMPSKSSTNKGMQDGTLPGSEIVLQQPTPLSLQPATLPSASTPKPKKMGAWEIQAKAQQDERERLAEQRRQRREAANQPPVVEKIVPTPRQVQMNYNATKKEADKATANLEKAQKALNANTAEIERLRSENRVANATKIKNLENKQERLSKALTSAEITNTRTQKAFASAEKTLEKTNVRYQGKAQ